MPDPLVVLAALACLGCTVVTAWLAARANRPDTHHSSRGALPDDETDR